MNFSIDSFGNKLFGITVTPPSATTTECLNAPRVVSMSFQ